MLPPGEPRRPLLITRGTGANLLISSRLGAEASVASTGLSLLTVPLTNREYPPPPPPSLSSSSSSSFFLLLLPGCFVFRCTPKTQLTDITLAPRHSFDNVYRSKPHSYAAFRPPYRSWGHYRDARSDFISISRGPTKKPRGMRAIIGNGSLRGTFA